MDTATEIIVQYIALLYSRIMQVAYFQNSLFLYWRFYFSDSDSKIAGLSSYVFSHFKRHYFSVILLILYDTEIGSILDFTVDTGNETEIKDTSSLGYVRQDWNRFII